MTPKFKLICQLVVSIMLISGAFAYFFALFFLGKNIDAAVKESVTLITGSMITTVAAVGGFWLGTSLSSAAKDSTISQLSKPPGA